jgi:glycosyltransferase involved in cell wall biosynthesis
VRFTKALGAICYNARVRVTLIFTVKNEAVALPKLLDSISSQTRSPDEVIVADGGSTDSTVVVLRQYSSRLPLKVLVIPGANISQGRNATIRAASGDLICSTDAGVRLDPNWLNELVKPFESGGGGRAKQNETAQTKDAPVDVVSGFFIADPQSLFETALAATTLPSLAEIRPDKFLPSSRSIAFRKSAWEQIHGYPEWLDFCEDLIFDFCLRASNFRFVFAPRACVYFRPRPDLTSFFKQYYHYARGDGKADLWRMRHLLRYLTYLVFLPLAIALCFSGFWLGVGIFILGFLGIFFTPYKRLVPMIRAMSPAAQLSAIAWVPIIRVTGDIAKMIGYPVGTMWRMKNRAGKKPGNFTTPQPHSSATEEKKMQ